MSRTVDQCLNEFNFCLTRPGQYTTSKVQFWADCAFKGATTRATTGDYPKIGDVGITDNKLSSFKVPKGLKLTIYTEANFKGSSKEYTGPVDVSCLKNICAPGSSRGQDGMCKKSWNDMVSSFRIRKMGAAAPPAARVTAAPAPAPAAPQSSAFKAPVGNYSAPQSGFDYPGNYITTSITANREECARQCDRYPTCKGFVTATDYGLCQLKSDFVNPTPNPKRIVTAKVGTILPGTGSAAAAATPAPAAAAPMALMAFTSPPSATWVKPGYKPVSTSSVPVQFRLKNAATGQYMILGPGNTIAEGAGTGVVIGRSRPSDLYQNSTTTNAPMQRLDTPAGAIRHSGFVLSANPYVPNNYDFAWKFLLKDGTTNRIIIWNPYPGDANGMYLQGGARPKIDPGTPTEYIIEPVAAGSGTSGYAMEGSPFGGAVGGRNWVLILTLLLVVILLWILSKNL